MVVSIVIMGFYIISFALQLGMLLIVDTALEVLDMEFLILVLLAIFSLTILF